MQHQLSGFYNRDVECLLRGTSESCMLFRLIFVSKMLVKRYTRRVKKKDRTFAIKTLFYNILNTAHFKVVPSTGDTPFPTFLPLLEYFLERSFSDGAQFSYRIFRNLRVFKKRPNFLKLFVGLIRRTACARALFSGCSWTTNAHSERGANGSLFSKPAAR
jgi:hypothetical protein